MSGQARVWAGVVVYNPNMPVLSSLILALEAQVERIVVFNNGGCTSAWCFTPSSFRLIMHDLFLLGLIDLREVCFFGTRGCEFYMTLGRHGSGPDKDRLGLLADIESELVSGAADRGLSKLMSVLKFWRR